MSRKIFTSFMTILMVVCMLMPIAVFADTYSISAGQATPGTVVCTTKTVTFIDSSITRDKLPCLDANTGILTVTHKGDDFELLQLIPATGGSKASIVVNLTAFEKCNQDKVTKAMRTFTDQLTNSGGSPETINQIMQDIQDTDSSVSKIMLPLIFEATKGDMYQAYKITSPFLNILSIVMGVGAVLVIVLLLFSTVMDLVYIGLPVWRNAQNEKGKKNPFGVSYDAMRTVEEVEGNMGGGSNGGEYKNAYIVYLKRRVLTYIILAICIMYLIAGGLSGIISFVLQLVSGITG